MSIDRYRDVTPNYTGIEFMVMLTKLELIPEYNLYGDRYWRMLGMLRRYVDEHKLEN